MTDQPIAGAALKPLDGAFITVETAGNPEAEKRQATIRIAFFGERAASRAYLARDYLDRLVKADTHTPASGAVEAAIKALEPFARAAGKLDGLWADDDCRWNDPTRSGVTVAHIRAASTALAALTSSPKAEGEAQSTSSLSRDDIDGAMP